MKKILMAFAVAVVSTAIPAVAQITTATLSGVVKDTSNAVIPVPP
jgi:hypothetical protein